MNISEALLTQVKRFKKTSSYHLSSSLKKELDTFYRSKGLPKLCMHCSSGQNRAMKMLADSIPEEEILKPLIHFIGKKHD
jgi:hypothetical protein